LASTLPTALAMMQPTASTETPTSWATTTVPALLTTTAMTVALPPN
jgi:hypothetical protein